MDRFTSLFQGKMLSIGAESKIYQGKLFDYDVIIKHRYPKSFRIPQIDLKLRKERTTQEARLMMAAKKAGINVPYILDIDKTEWKITMDYIEGTKLKDLMIENGLQERFNKIGLQVAMLHNNDIIHGDLTSSNIIITEDDEVWLIDFGLGFTSPQLEDQTVDLMVLKHILESSHPLLADQAFAAFLQGYAEEKSNLKQLLKRLDIIEKRVRYKSH